ncbi:MAG: thiosulfate sulfurtransferase [Candidatus Eisenbacteria bacterium]|nr:thiosulfate sulfurtransferase [Candidatus Eisenbacteria bacterium]
MLSSVATSSRKGFHGRDRHQVTTMNGGFAMPSALSLTQLTDAVDRGNMKPIDVRQMDAWNGWSLQSEARGGHIPGAVSLPARWLEELDGRRIVSWLAKRDVTPSGDVAVYGHGRQDAASVAQKLEALGYDAVRVFEGGYSAWAADPERPVDRMKRFHKLVPEQWLAQLLAGGTAERHDGRRHMVAHVSFDNRDDYDEGHIPGSLYLDTLLLERPEDWNRRAPAELEKAVLGLGITYDTTVVLYGRTGSPTMKMKQPGRHAGQIAAMRAAWLLRYVGVADVRVLNGGLASWERAGREVSTEETPPTPVSGFGRKIPARPDLIVTTPEARDLLSSRKGDLVSMRSWEEFIGETSGYHYVGPQGRIPGAVFGNCGSDAYHMENYRNHDQTMRPYHEIAAMWEEAELLRTKRVAFYCGTGWRASEAAFYAYLMGWERAAVYDDGWFGWSSDVENPIASGVPDGYEGRERPEGALRADPLSEQSRGRIIEGPRSDRPPDDCVG